MINRVTLVGNLGRDPDLRRLESGVAVARLSLATSERYRDSGGDWREQIEWHDIVLWRGLAERAETQLRKGMLVYLEGKLSTRQYNDRSGQLKKATEIVANDLRILNRRADVEDDPPQGQLPASPPGITITPPAQNSSTAVPPRSDNAEDASELPF